MTDVDLTFQSGGLSADHIEKHLLEFTHRSQKAGYHGGLSANAHIALLQEPPSNVHHVLNRMYRDPKGKRVNPFGCAITECMIWYMRGISHDWNAYGGKGFQNLRNGQVCMTYEEALADSYKLAIEEPGKASRRGTMEVAEVERVRKRLELPVVTQRMTDDTCVYCQTKYEFQYNPYPDEAAVPPDDYEPDYDDQDEADDEREG